MEPSAISTRHFGRTCTQRSRRHAPRNHVANHGYGGDWTDAERGRSMGIIRDMQRAHATQTAAEQRAHTAAAQQRELIRRNADLAIAAAQQAAADAQRTREHRRLYVHDRTADATA